MPKSIAYKHYLRALSQWPQDSLRPGCQFQDIIRRRVDKKFVPGSLTTSAEKSLGQIKEKSELEQANALYLLLENRFTKRHPVVGSLMRPASNPTYYSDLITELESAPSRGLWDRVKNKMKGILRFR
ncbi:hypothetical protein K3495_g3346 [Podosphaera aphanis]|nr:hypothetical protein K3495_g3346 [Podosphaera aphanis]